VIKGPNEIAEAYFQKVSMLTGGLRGVEVVVEEMTTKERASYLAKQCDGREEGAKEEVVEQEKDDKNPVLFLMKTGAVSKETRAGGLGEKSKDVLVCVPTHSAAKAVLQQINEQMGSPCKRTGHGGNLEGCRPVDDHLQNTNATVNILLTRHPFDRLIIEFRRWKASVSSKKEVRSKRSSLGNQIDHNLVTSQNYQETRKVFLESSSIKKQRVFHNTNDEARIRKRRSFARHRNILRGRGGRGRGQQFRQFLKSKVLGTEGPFVRPVTEVCGACKRRWDQVVRLEDSDDQLSQVLESLGRKDIIAKQVGRKLKSGGRETQRRFFSQVTAEEMELLYDTFKEDFLLFGYNLDFYKS